MSDSKCPNCGGPTGYRRNHPLGLDPAYRYSDAAAELEALRAAKKQCAEDEYTVTLTFEELACLQGGDHAVRSFVVEQILDQVRERDGADA